MPLKCVIIDSTGHEHDVKRARRKTHNGMLAENGNAYVVDTRMATERLEPRLVILGRFLPPKKVMVLRWHEDYISPLNMLQKGNPLPASSTPQAVGARMYSEVIRSFHNPMSSPIMLILCLIGGVIMGAVIAFLAQMV